MVRFQSRFVILSSTHGSLWKFGCSWSAMDKKQTSLDTVTEQTIFNFLRFICSMFFQFLQSSIQSSIIVSTQHHKICCAVKYLTLPKRLSYQFSAFKDLYIRTKLCNKFLKKLFHKTIWPYVEYWPPYIHIT